MDWEPGEKEELWRQMQEVWFCHKRRRRPLPLISLLGMVMFFLVFSILAAHAFSLRTQDLARPQAADRTIAGLAAVVSPGPGRSDRL